MKKNLKYLSQKGSMMVEALAMLGLITMVTPVLYKKAAERTTELQDINTATQLRTLSKALDDYIEDNYNDLAGGAAGEKVIDKDELEAYLPYNFNLDTSKLFDGYQFAIRNEKIYAGTEKEHSAITGVVLAKALDEIPMLRASKIASMVGANGGVVREKEIKGVQGGWGAPLGDFFSDTDVPDGSLATSSVHAVTSSGGGADARHVLYRDTSKGDPMYNTMETTLYMGGETIEDVSRLVASSEAGRDGTPAGAVTIDGNAITSGNLEVGGDADVARALSANSATITTTLDVGDKATVGSLLSQGVAEIGGLLTAKAGVDVTGGDVNIQTGKLNAKGGASVSGNYGAGDSVNSQYTLVTDGNLLVKNNVHVMGSMKIDTDLIANNLFGINSIGGGQLSNGSYNFLANASQVSVAGNNLTVGTASDPRIKTTDSVVQAGIGTTQMHIEGGEASLEASGGSVWVDNQGNAGLQGSNIVNVRVVSGSTAPTYLTMDSGGATLVGDEIEAVAGNANLEMANNSVQLGLVSSSSGAKTYAANLDIGSDGAVLTGVKGKSSVREPTLSLTSGELTVDTDNVFIDENLVIDDDYIVFDTNAQFPDEENVGADANSIYENRSSGVRLHRQGIIQLPMATNSAKKNLSKDDGKQNVPGYIKLDRIIANQVYPTADELGTGDYTLNLKAAGDAATSPYDAYQVNPAYTSVMHDIKLTTRGGARLSDILPDFINKGIYVLDNTYEEELDKTAWEKYHVDTSRSSFIDAKDEPKSCSSADCIATPWLGFVPTPQCPPGYSKVITINPIRWKMAEAYYIPGGKPTAGDVADKFRAYFIPPTDPTTAHFQLAEADGTAGSHTHGLKEGSGFPLTFQTNTWLNTTVSGVRGEGGTAESSTGNGANRYDSFVGWHAIMGFLYYAVDYKEYLIDIGQASLAEKNVVIWNLFPVYNEEMTAIANVYCYFERRNMPAPTSWSWGSSYVDTGYDQLTNFRYGFEKHNDKYNLRLNDPALGYDEVW